MVRQPRWDQYEAALLLDYCVGVEEKKISKVDAVEAVSELLRARARAKGIQIDDTFRNINGITMQLASMRNCCLGREKGLTISKLFKEVVCMYKNDRERFDEILQEETETMNSTNWSKFLLWLRDENPNTEKDTVALLRTVNVFALKNRVIQVPLGEITDSSEIEKVQHALTSPSMLGLHSKKTAAKASKAVDAYLTFLHIADEANPVKTETEITSISKENSPHFEKVDFSQMQDYAHTKPVKCTYKGIDVPCPGWNAAYINLVRTFFQENRGRFPTECKLSDSGRTDIGSSTGMTYPKEIAEGIYLECNVSATGIVNKLRSLLGILPINYNDLTIEYRFNSNHADNTQPTEKPPAPKAVVQWQPQYSKELSRLIASHYRYGFRLGSPIELMRLRNYAETENIILPEDDELLEREIAAVGMEIDGKIRVIDSNLLEETGTLSDQVFESGCEVIFLEKLLEKNADWFDEQHIVSTDMLKEILKKCRPQYYFGQNIITPSQKRSEQESIVSEILRISEDKAVILLQELEEKLEYIPIEKISWNLSMSPEFVWISEGKYFLMRCFDISEEEKKAILNYVSLECGIKGYASLADIPYGKTAENNHELTSSALQAAVYNAVLREAYFLHGKILTKDASGVDAGILLRAYCSDKDSCTIAEMVDRSTELTGASNKQLAMRALYDSMIRADEKVFVSERHVCFDVESIDALLTDMIGTGFAPIKGITTFALFPSCGISWNHYVLESYCYRFSKKYRLSVLNFNDKNAGLIESVKLSLTYTDMLCEAAAKAPVTLTPEAVGDYFFENGYTARRKYSNLPDIVIQANKIRERG